jgi:hypothetical protein
LTAKLFLIFYIYDGIFQQGQILPEEGIEDDPELVYARNAVVEEMIILSGEISGILIH